MKVKGEVSETLLLGKDLDINKCKDKESYIKKTSPAVLILGIIITICGVITCLRHYILQGNELIIFLDPIVNFIAVITIIIFGIYTTKQKKIYF
jgi:uncharacterized membrane protein